ncbi:MAG: type II toxin-antitoxin system RelE/ParE family toxin [Chloroflexi bacterium]|nr:type II toxin-antitoxin system RelE/ParE family toxin [Chloroflexota bacterium]
MFASFQRLADNPTLGQERNDLRPGLRIVLHLQHYYICYRIE